MKKLYIITFLCLLVSVASHTKAQSDNKDVTITASGSGKTLEEAKQAALRSATEQAFGAFFSSKIEIFNDQVIADQMSSVSSGNIKSYEILNEAQLPDGRWGVTLRAIVSVDKLTSFVQSKGISVEFKGDIFEINIKQQILNEESEITAISELIGLLHEPMQTSFDYEIHSKEPKSLDDENLKWEIPLEITATANKNMDICVKYFIETIASIQLTNDQIEDYIKLNKNIYYFSLTHNKKNYCVALRKNFSIKMLYTFINNWRFYVSGFTVSNQEKTFSNWSGGEIHKISEILSENNYSINKKSMFCRKSFSSLLHISFISSGDVAGRFSWKEIKTLKEIKNLTNYSVKPNGIRSEFKFGGFVVKEKNKYLIVSLADIGNIPMNPWGVGEIGGEGHEDHQKCMFDYNEAEKKVKELNINGFNDWRLPNFSELQLINSQLNYYGLGSFFESTYWCDNLIGYGSFNLTNNMYQSQSMLFKSGVRAVRKFKPKINN